MEAPIKDFWMKYEQSKDKPQHLKVIVDGIEEIHKTAKRETRRSAIAGLLISYFDDLIRYKEAGK